MEQQRGFSGGLEGQTGGPPRIAERRQPQPAIEPPGGGPLYRRRLHFTLIAERATNGGNRSLGITSNLVFSEWERIFANPMATAAAIDRVVHHSVILEFDVPSYRTDAAQQRNSASGRTGRGGEPAKLVDAKPARMLDAGHRWSADPNSAKPRPPDCRDGLRCRGGRNP